MTKKLIYSTNAGKDFTIFPTNSTHLANTCLMGHRNKAAFRFLTSFEDVQPRTMSLPPQYTKALLTEIDCIHEPANTDQQIDQLILSKLDLVFEKIQHEKKEGKPGILTDYMNAAFMRYAEQFHTIFGVLIAVVSDEDDLDELPKMFHKVYAQDQYCYGLLDEESKVIKLLNHIEGMENAA